MHKNKLNETLINYWIHECCFEWMNELRNKWINECMKINGWMNEYINWLLNPWIRRWINEYINWLMNPWIPR